MVSKYPSIPSPSLDLASVYNTVTAMRQTLQILTINTQPSSTPVPGHLSGSNVFSTSADRIPGPPGPAGPAGPAGPVGPAGPSGGGSVSVPANMMSFTSPPVSTSTVYLMLGLGLTMSTLLVTRAWLGISGTISNSTNNGETDLMLYYGTGSPPANGAAVTGTVIGSAIRYVASTGGSFGPFSKSVLLTGLAQGTVYWFDMAMKAVSGTAGVSDIDIAVHGLV